MQKGVGSREEGKRDTETEAEKRRHAVGRGEGARTRFASTN